jgi:ribose transport system permease protein
MPIRSSSPSNSGRVWAAAAAIFVIGWITVSIRGGRFVTVPHLQQLVSLSIALGLVTLGQTVVMLAGSIDLSVVYTVSVAAVLTGGLTQGHNARLPLALLAVVAVAAGIGLVNGLVVTVLRTNGFIATLGTRLALFGLLYWKVQNYNGSVPSHLRAVAYQTVAYVPISLFVLLVVAAVAWYLVHRTPFGYHLFGLGGNADAALLSGVRNTRVMLMAHVFCAVCAGLAGIYLAARTGGNPDIGTQGAYDLASIAAACVGGVAIIGGRGSISGAMAGVLILSIIDLTFDQIPEISGFVRTALRGVIIVGAVALYSYRERRVTA